MDEGYIKFKMEWRLTGAFDIPQELLDCRQALFAKNWIGEENGIGFGNVSIRNPKNSEEFFISATQTGSIPEIQIQDFAKVEKVEKADLGSFVVQCSGPQKASSESTSHWAFYQGLKTCGAVLHIHSQQLWKRWMDKIPTIPKGVEYGTPAMANAILYHLQQNKGESGVIIMAGHEDGLFAFGKKPQWALEALLQLES